MGTTNKFSASEFQGCYFRLLVSVSLEIRCGCKLHPEFFDRNSHHLYPRDQVVRQSVLIPSSATSRIINVQTCSGCDAGIGQFRLEVDNSGSAQRYLLNVLQARSNSQANVIKGQTSIGGSINLAGGGVSLLRPGVQTIT
jgi:hypothetical protein